MDSIVMTLLAGASLFGSSLVGQLLRKRRGMDRLERMARTLRERRNRPLRYVVRDPGDRERTPELDVLAGELVSNGMRVLGDAIEADSDQPLVHRWFVDAGERTFGFAAVLRRANRTMPMAQLFSGFDEGSHVTYRFPRIPILPMDPRDTSLQVPPSASIPELVVAHRARVAERRAEVRTIVTLDEALGAATARWDRTRAWRDAQPADALLEADVRAILGKTFQLHGEALIKRLRPRLPAARVTKSRP